jgi:ATP-binding cassette, subfamily C, bacterial
MSISFFKALKIIKSQLIISPARSILILFLSLLAGILEGASIALLVPLVEIIVNNKIDELAKYSYLSFFSEFIGIALTSASILISFCIFIVLKSLFNLAAMNYIGKVIAIISFELREAFVAALINSQWTYAAQQSSGEFINAINFEISKASTVYRYSCVIIATSFQVLALFFVLYSFSSITALGGLILGILLFITLGYYVRLASEQSKLQVEVMNKLISKIHQMLLGIKVIKAMNLSRLITPIISSHSETIKLATQLQVVAKHGLSYLREPIIVIFLSIGIYIAISGQTLEPEIIFGSLVLFLRLASSLGKLQSDYQVFLVNSHFYIKFQEKLDNIVNSGEFYGEKKTLNSFDNIEYQNVSYSHDARDLLEGVNFKLNNTGFISITGESGLGKTTLIDMLIGLYSPIEGAILFDNQNIKDLGVNSIRNKVGYVEQETFIFNESVYINISLGDKEISKNDVIFSLKEANAYNFVSLMPDGLDTNLGESGSKLSGGQKQRIAIARALVRKPLILILDEATSALDKKTMLEILEVIKKLSKSILVIAITHQKEVIDNSDQVYFIENKTLSLMK